MIWVLYTLNAECFHVKHDTEKYFVTGQCRVQNGDMKSKQYLTGASVPEQFVGKFMYETL